MDALRSIQRKVQELDRQQLIDVRSLQIWFALLVVSFGSVSWLWNHFVVEDDPTSHFPPGLLPPDVRRRLPDFGFTTEKEARAFATKEIEAAIIACRENADKSDASAVDAVHMMKSAALLSKSIIHFHIYTEDSLYATFMKELDRWPSYIRHRVSFQFSHVTYPESLLGWKKSKKPCSSFKLFIPNLLKQCDFAIYVDSDTVFLNSLDAFWRTLTRFKPAQVMSLAATRLHEGALSKHGIKSLDTRAVIFDIFRMRHSVFRVPVSFKRNRGMTEFKTENMTWHPNMLHRLYQLFSEDITTPDQDIISVLYHFNKDKFFMQSSEWTFRWDYCHEYLTWVKSRFLNSTLEHWPMLKNRICDKAFMVHKSQIPQSSQEENRHFEDLQRFWGSASFDNPKKDVLQSVKLASKSKLSNGTCYKLNMELFIDSMKSPLAVAIP